METDRSSASYLALQVVGSPTSGFFFDLSMLYAEKVVCPEGFSLLFAVAYPDGSWSVQDDLNEQGERISLAEMSARVRAADIVVPHLFCEAGLTSIRTYFEEILNLPLVGSSGYTLRLAQNKHLTKLIADDLKVPVPYGKIISAVNRDDARWEDLAYPLIVKPNTRDNSDGLSLVKSADELDQALTAGFAVDTDVLVEAYIPGRELRGAIIVQDGELIPLPFIEYGVSDKFPIRVTADKLKVDSSGKLIEQSAKLNVPAECPAEIDPELLQALHHMMTLLHVGLGCRDFSMYDFRVSEEGKPYLLEAGLFWSFSETSMISSMLRAAGRELSFVTQNIWMRALRRGRQKDL